jgi:hypothetical protein
MIDYFDASNLYKEIEIVGSAYKHGLEKSDILHAFSCDIYNETLQVYPNKTLVIGYDTKTRLIEIICDIITDEHVVIFHAMECRKFYRERINK